MTADDRERSDRMPVLVGIGTSMQRHEDAVAALEPIDLMLRAVENAGHDCGAADALAGAQYIACMQGRWFYQDPARAIGHAIGASNATSVLASVGVMQQTVISEACERIQRGEIHTALVAGADAGYRLLRGQVEKLALSEREAPGTPDIHLRPDEELRHPAELRAGLQMPVGLYAIMESAWRAKHGQSPEEHADALARLGERFSAVAAANPHAWQRQPVGAADFAASPRNPLQAFPYTRLHCSNWNVDQAAALLFCSVSRAKALGIAQQNWIYPVAAAESNHMVPVSARADISACPGAELTGRAVLDAAGLDAAEVDVVDLYSCFPLAVNVYADALGLPPARDLTVTGGMVFAGGPYNNYLFQAVCRAAEMLRAGQGRTALLSCVSGVLTKQAFCLWSVEPPENGFVRLDVTDEVADDAEILDVVEDFTGEGRIVGYTVLHGRGRAPKGVALLDTAPGQRALAVLDEAGLLDQMQRQEFVGRRVTVTSGRIDMTDRSPNGGVPGTVSAPSAAL